ncbi:hypothetical protein SPI_07277 [Niveomyces insectorum RCEF 264]|uniref:DUF1446 domain containing protein n=1 Tax=Niveomyces insectorum RCEF 264 TaxID=1081102 RepID=A0A167QGD9_9HYPO|nr:hypothetical protein SPI_07277 [Niveomyces insectorum RCEF 264]
MAANNKEPRRPVRIGGASGGFTDRVAAIHRLASDPDVDAVVGDWLSENVMTGYGAGKVRQQGSGRERLSLEERMKTAQYASTFLQCFAPAIHDLARNGTKLAVNAGASDTELLAEVVVDMVKKVGLDLKVAWVEGDDVTATFLEMAADKQNEFRSLTDGKTLAEWNFKPLCAQAYLGSLGIAEALRRGADIVICGRVSDAAPTIGVAAWWHNWTANQLDELAGALVAGHVIECSAFVTGGYYSRFKELMAAKKHLNLGFPIASVYANGEFDIGKEKNTNGVVNPETVTSQLVYEISGPLYYNSDVVADLHNIRLAETAADLVHVSGVRGRPPPPTTRCGITAHGGYQAEWHFYLVGLDIEEKCRWMEEQARYAIGEELISQFSLLKFHVHGTSPPNPVNQEIATVDFRIFAQAPDAALFDPGLPDGFARKLYETVLQSCPGVSRPNDLRQSTAKSYFEYFVTLIPQSACRHRVHLLFGDEATRKTPIEIPLPPQTQEYGAQESYDTKHPVDLAQFGETVEAPLGWVALGRSGDKASDANVGFFVSTAEQWDWLRTFLTISKIKQLLGPAEYGGGGVDRFEMANIRAVHFLLKDHLDRGYNSGSKLDTLAKNLCEYLRAKYVPIPKKFIENGHL